ncbi:MAG TPA: SDR family oxidoreductase [Thermoanaerobaculia bacterium]|nr:SDR family oxidoreductase [Thermoanaerobaculia bacterium]
MSQTILITGAGRGLGLGLARSWAAAGDRVIATCRRPPEAAELAALAAARDVRPLRLDVTERESIEQAAATLGGEAIDLLVLNAGVYGPRDRQGLGAIDDQAFARVLDVNLLGALRVAETMLPLVERSRRKVIAAITSQMGSIARSWGGSYAYRASKAGLNAAMRALSIDLRARGVAVLVVHPGWVRTDMGGGDATLSVEESVRGLRALLDRAGLEHSGRFFDVDGSEIPW